MWHVFWKEIKSLCHNMIASIYVAASTAIIGVYFMAQNMQNGYPLFSASLMNAFLVLIVAVPVLTMRSFAEERSSKTEQLLLTSPISVSAIVVGKFLATVVIFAIPFVFLGFCPLIIQKFGQAYLLVDYSFFAAYFVVGLLFISIGIFISSLTESQVIAAVGTFTTLLLLYLVYILVDYVPTDAFGTMVVCMIASALAGVAVYALTKSDTLGLGTTAVLAALVAGLYVRDKSLYENLLPALLNNFSVMAILRNIVEYRLVDVLGLFRMAVMSVVMLVFTQLSLQQRRWS